MQLSTVTDPFGIWGRAAGAARRGAGAALDRSEIAAIELLSRAVASARAEEALDIVLRSPLADRAVRSIVDGPLLDVAVRTAVERGVVERIVDEIMGTPLPHHVTDQLLASDELWHVVDEIARSPSVTAAITQQSAGFADQVAGEVGRRSRRADDRLDRAARRFLHRRDPSVQPDPPLQPEPS